MNQSKLVMSRLQEANRSVEALEPLAPNAIDVVTGYCMQCQALDQRLAGGERLTGWKIAFAGSAAQKRFGITEPVFGALTNAMRVDAGSTVKLSRLIAPKLEVELAFVLGRTLVPGDYEDRDILAAISDVAPAFEIADCRWQNWRFEVGAFLADNAASGLYCLGPTVAFDPEAHACTTYALHRGEVACGAGDTEGREDTPQVNLCWLIRRLLADGHPVEAGQIVLSGALLPPLDIQPAAYRLQMLGMELAMVFEADTHAV